MGPVAPANGEGDTDVTSGTAKVFAVIEGRRTPIQTGAVVGQVRRVDGRCQIDSPVGVSGESRNGEPLYRIRWHFDERCQMVITEVTPVTASTDTGPPSGGRVQEAKRG